MCWDGFRLAVSLLSVVPVRAGRAVRTGPADGAAGVPAGTHVREGTGGAASISRQTAAAAMAWAPAVGLALGAAAAAVLVCADHLLRAGPLLAAVLAIATLTLLTRGLHLDGLADLADGLGSGKPAAQALEIMKRSDIGPFGVAALVLTLFAQIAALAQAQGSVAHRTHGITGPVGHGPAALVAATVAGPRSPGRAAAPFPPRGRTVSARLSLGHCQRRYLPCSPSWYSALPRSAAGCSPYLLATGCCRLESPPGWRHRSSFPATPCAGSVESPGTCSAVCPSWRRPCV